MPQTTLSQKFRAVAEQLNSTFVKRESVVRVMQVALLSRSHYLLVGDPGTGKTALVRAFMAHLAGARSFVTLLGSFTPPEQVFGPLSIPAFQAGRYEHVTGGKLPASDVAFCDEFLKAGDGLLNTMLGVLEDRTYEGQKCPLISMGAATNWPEVDRRDERIAALYDRMLLRCVVDTLTTEQDVVRMLAASDRVDRYVPGVAISMPELLTALTEVDAVQIPDQVRLMLHQTAERVADRDQQGRARVKISSRRLARLQAALRAHAWLEGRDTVSVEDFEMLRHGLWSDRKDIESVSAVLSTLDHAEVSAAIKQIEAAREQIRGAERGGYGVASVKAASEETAKAALAVQARLKDPVWTKAGRARVLESMGVLKADLLKMQAATKGM